MPKMVMFFICILSCAIQASDLDQNLRQLFFTHGVRPLQSYKSPTPHLVKLGKKLFADPILSGNKNISCQTCHHPDHGTSDKLPLSIGEGGEGTASGRSMGQGHIIPRNSPALWNLAKAPNMFWDARVERDPVTGALFTPEAKLNGLNPELKQYTAQLDSALAAQAMFPPSSAEEMSGAPGSNEIANAKTNVAKWQGLSARVVADSNYRDLLALAYPDVALSQINFAHLARAIAEFEKENFQATRTPLDLFLAGDASAMNDKQKLGALFFVTKGKCIECHHGPLLSDFKTHAIGMPQIGPGKDQAHDDLGRMHVTGNFADRYAFRTPPLRNVIISGPWGHAGSFRDMRDLILHYFHPQRTLHHYTPDNQGLPYKLVEQLENKQARFQSMDPRVMVGLDMSQEEFEGLHDFLVFALSDY